MFMLYLVIGAVSLATFAALEESCFGSALLRHLVIIDGLLGELRPHGFHIVTGHFLVLKQLSVNYFIQ